MATVLITFFFGLFGLIPAARGARRARRLGQSGERFWLAFAASFAGSVLLYALIAVMTVVLVIHSDGPTPTAATAIPSKSSSSPPPIHLAAERIPPGEIHKLCDSPTSPLEAWGAPDHWEDPNAGAAPPTGPLLDSFGAYACQIHTRGVILQLEVLDLTQDGITWPPSPESPDATIRQLAGVADRAWAITDPGSNASVQVDATSGNVGVAMLVLAVKGWSPTDVDATVRAFTEQVKAAIVTLATLEK